MSLDPSTRALFEGPNFAHLATLMPDGSPQVTALWIGIDGDRPIFAKEETSVAARNLRWDPRVAISIIHVEDPYDEAHLRGRAVEVGGAKEVEAWLARRALEYLDGPYPDRDPGPCILYSVEVDRAGHWTASDIEHTPPRPCLQLRRSDKKL